MSDHYRHLRTDIDMDTEAILLNAEDVVAYLRACAETARGASPAIGNHVDQIADALASEWIECALIVRRVMDE